MPKAFSLCQGISSHTTYFKDEFQLPRNFSCKDPSPNQAFNEFALSGLNTTTKSAAVETTRMLNKENCLAAKSMCELTKKATEVPALSQIFNWAKAASCSPLCPKIKTVVFLQLTLILT
jgi:hypothetical protein